MPEIVMKHFYFRLFLTLIWGLLFWNLWETPLSAAQQSQRDVAQKLEQKVPALPIYNQAILAALPHMPKGGGYGTSLLAKWRLQQAISLRKNGLLLRPERARPSFCSEATYLLLLKTLVQLAQENHWHYDREALKALKPTTFQKDGEGAWGYWNANGPGAALFFYRAGLGRNFTDIAEAQPGDFLKFFWSPEIGVRERGHLVLYLGCVKHSSGTYLRYWSSNIPRGYGVNEVRLSQLHHLIFSRLTHPERLEKPLPSFSTNQYLSRLLKKRSSFTTALHQVGVH